MIFLPKKWHTSLLVDNPKETLFSCSLYHYLQRSSSCTLELHSESLQFLFDVVNKVSKVASEVRSLIYLLLFFGVRSILENVVGSTSGIENMLFV